MSACMRQSLSQSPVSCVSCAETNRVLSDRASQGSGALANLHSRLQGESLPSWDLCLCRCFPGGGGGFLPGVLTFTPCVHYHRQRVMSAQTFQLLSNQGGGGGGDQERFALVGLMKPPDPEEESPSECQWRGSNGRGGTFPSGVTGGFLRGIRLTPFGRSRMLGGPWAASTGLWVCVGEMPHAQQCVKGKAAGSWVSCTSPPRPLSSNHRKRTRGQAHHKGASKRRRGSNPAGLPSFLLPTRHSQIAHYAQMGFGGETNTFPSPVLFDPLSSSIFPRAGFTRCSTFPSLLSSAHSPGFVSSPFCCPQISGLSAKFLFKFLPFIWIHLRKCLLSVSFSESLNNNIYHVH